MKVILFDGVCNLCNASVNWLIGHDKKNMFKYSSLQSTYGQRAIRQQNLTGSYMDTVLFIDEDKVYTRSDAALQILKYIGGIYSLAVVFFIIPRFVRDFVYRIVANNRYRWFGKHDSCRVPTPELKSKFLE